MTKPPKAHTEDVDALRKILKHYDDGLCTASEVGGQVLRYLLAPHMKHVKEGRESGWGSSWCGGEPPPPQRATIEFGSTRIWFFPERPVDDDDRECPGAGCPMCTGKSCNICPADCLDRTPGVPVCQHDILDRHMEPGSGGFVPGDRPKPDHDWAMTQHYDDAFFTCRLCGLKTHQRRGFPAKTAEECLAAGLSPCKGIK